MKPFVLDEPVNGTFWPELEPVRELGDCGTGYYNVSYSLDDTLIIGYRFEYFYEYTGKNKNSSYRTLNSISLPRLRKKVLTAGLPWEVMNIEDAMRTLTLNLLDLHERNVVLAERLMNDSNFSGVAYVRRCFNANMKNKYLWKYEKYANNKIIHLSAGTLKGLEQKVKNKGVPWEILSEDVYNEIIMSEEISL